MKKWKLCRQTYGNEEFTLSEGDEVTIGRAISNTITLSSIVISRNHCVLKVQEHQVLVTDLKSSNGVYVGQVKIPQNKPYILKDSDIIGIGWASEAPLADINDNEKFVFKLGKENNTPNILKRIRYQSENENDGIEKMLAELDSDEASISLTTKHKLSLKRKADIVLKNDIKLEFNEKKIPKTDIVNLLSDSDNEIDNNQNEIFYNKIKLEPICEENRSSTPLESTKNQIKYEKDLMEYEAFDVKQEYHEYEDEAIIVDSDSDGESEHWYLRLSQNSPGKPFIRKSQEMLDMQPDDSSYSQMEDDYISIPQNVDEEEEYLDDLITIPPEPIEQISEANKKSDEEYLDDIICLDINLVAKQQQSEPVLVNDKPSSIEPMTVGMDEVDAYSSSLMQKDVTESTEMHIFQPKPSPVRKTQMIEPLTVGQKLRTKYEPEKKSKSSTSKHSKVEKHCSKRHISNSQKEERRKRLKAIAIKEKEGNQDVKNSSNGSNKSSKSQNKITISNQSAFLVDSVQVVKPVARKEEDKDKYYHKSKSKSSASPSQPVTENKPTNGNKMSPLDVENITKDAKTKNLSSNKPSHTKTHDAFEINKVREPLKSLKPLESAEKSESCKNKSHESTKESIVPLMSVKPRMESKDAWSGKPILKVVPVVLPPKKPKKAVRFSDAAPQIHTFEIEPGNKMKRTSLVKTSLVDIRQIPVFSLEKITLMKILRWNPHWLDEQANNNEPPPILGHNNPPMSTLHSYANHHQYLHLLGDLLLMEIWESLSIAHMKNQSYAKNMLKMRIGSLPPIPTQERCHELFNISVDISVPSNGPKNIVPRVGEILLVSFGPDNAKTKRFFYVQNVRCLPSPPNNIHSYFSISLNSTFTDKMKSLRQGGEMLGVTLACISNELNLFEAMEHLAGSPLSEAILKPEPRHFQSLSPGYEINSYWTQTLNPSQRTAVTCSVSAALGDKPSIQMVQGPPGTGKSSVICAMVMTYFYGEHSNKLPNRGKILICATSNAAVDELVLRLLKIRQSLPKVERFRMVRVGRVESMHSRARDVSSQQLAQRDVQRALSEPVPHPGLHEEISHLEAKVNMWKTQAQDAKDPVRVAYCQGRVSELVKRITLVKAGGGIGTSGELRPDHLFAAERKFIEGADIVLTTLASAHNHKMKGLKRRIALCIIDEAGQAIEPETLIPLTLDATRLTLIGDPQQLPGYICSQRAKKHGLGESLFSRLTSSAEHWPQGNPVVLLNQQYRMHPHIADYPNRAFYGGKVLSTGPQRPPHLAMPPYAIIGISSGDKGQGASGANEMEACGVSRLVVALNAVLRSHSQLSLAVITPYKAHKDLIKKHLKNLQDPSETPVEVNTVDSFQGQERDVVVVSLARSHGVGFLTDAGRMNVMLTRAKHALLIVLNPHALTKNHQWRTLIEDAQNRKMYKMLPNKMCQPGPVPHDILNYIK